MSIAIAPDWRASTPLPKSKQCKGINNDTASPHLKIVHIPTAMRHLTLARMFLHWTPKAEQIVDYLMGLGDAAFHFVTTTVFTTPEELALIGDALGPVDSLTLMLDDGELDDDEPSDEELEAMLIA